MDVLRPLRFPMSAINESIIKVIAASPFIRDAKQNHEAWEQKMAQLWR
jgi:beta-hydroxylase